ncbi:MAG: hypothetical protein GY822_32815 [Deltaproteobacteria bacterium]|nr:hypothetical protein [Deltaproteobacteria bacterium]
MRLNGHEAHLFKLRFEEHRAVFKGTNTAHRVSLERLTPSPPREGVFFGFSGFCAEGEYAEYAVFFYFNCESSNSSVAVFVVVMVSLTGTISKTAS